MKLPDKYIWEAGYLTAAEPCRCFPCKTAQNPGKRSNRAQPLLNRSRTAWGTFGWMLTGLRPNITWKIGQEWSWWRVVAPSPAILASLSLAAARLPAPGGSRLRIQDSRGWQQQLGVVWSAAVGTAGSVLGAVRMRLPDRLLRRFSRFDRAGLTGGNALATDDRQFVVKILRALSFAFVETKGFKKETTSYKSEERKEWVI